jgi:chromosome segregation ATPase
LQYLEKGGEEEWLEALEDLLVKIIIEKNSPEELQDIFWEFYQTQVKERKGFRRFSTSKMAFWERFVEKIAIALRDERIKSLEEENEELRRKLKELEERNAKYEGYIKELTRLLVTLMSLTDTALEKVEEFKKENERYKEIVRRANKVLEELTTISQNEDFNLVN